MSDIGRRKYNLICKIYCFLKVNIIEYFRVSVYEMM